MNSLIVPCGILRTYSSTGDLCRSTNSLPYFRSRNVGFEVPALYNQVNKNNIENEFGVRDWHYTLCESTMPACIVDPTS